MKRIVAFVFVLLAGTSIAWAETASITPSLFGYSIGQTWDEVKAVRRIRKKTIMGKDTGLIDNIKVAGVNFQAMVTFDSGKAVMIFGKFNSKDFPLLQKALTLKYGPAKEKDSVVRNRMGASFEQKESEWFFGNGELLSVQRFSGRLSEGLVSLISERAIDVHVEEKKKEIQALRDGL